MNATEYETKRERALIARHEAAELRELHAISQYSLDRRLSYGTKHVPRHIALRIADQFPIWAAEYDAAADQIEADMESMFTKQDQL
jgi:hypothetical protein